MKRKKWSEAEERSLLSKYAALVSTGTLSALKTREKRFKPVADHVNHLHHRRDPVAFPFRWSWRDVSIKIQNMRRQYLGVKQKIRLDDHRFDWADGDNHWENFNRYKEVFGDLELQDDDTGRKPGNSSSSSEDGDCGENEGLGGLGFDVTDQDGNDDETHHELGAGSDDGQLGGPGIDFHHQIDKKLRAMSRRILELRCGSLEREDRRRERELDAQKAFLEMRQKRMRMDELREQREQEAEIREMRQEDAEMEWEQQQMRRWVRMDEEAERERRRWRMKAEEKWEEEEMEWRERMVRLQIEHQKSMMQMCSDACRNQLQVLGVVSRLLCHLFASASDGLGAPRPPHIMQNMPPRDFDYNVVKSDANSQPQFL
uniref:Uncharacterized protein n=1 Tax=Kalanchoe fedtschenkoi TaxID=63787 RepID=A0A7N0TJS8_KALFE